MLISILFMIVVISLNDLRITNSAIVTSKYNNLVVCGPSGVGMSRSSFLYFRHIFSHCIGTGKGTLIQSILHKYRDQMALSVSQTTRAPRQGEVPGFHYDFVSRNYISSLGEEALQQYFLEHTIIHGKHTIFFLFPIHFPLIFFRQLLWHQCRFNKIYSQPRQNLYSRYR